MIDNDYRVERWACFLRCPFLVSNRLIYSCLHIGSMGVIAYRTGTRLATPCDAGSGIWNISNDKGKYVKAVCCYACFPPPPYLFFPPSLFPLHCVSFASSSFNFAFFIYSNFLVFANFSSLSCYYNSNAIPLCGAIHLYARFIHASSATSHPQSFVMHAFFRFLSARFVPGPEVKCVASDQPPILDDTSPETSHNEVQSGNVLLPAGTSRNDAESFLLQHGRSSGEMEKEWR